MTLETEALIDRRRLKRLLSLWRLGALVAVAALLLSLVLLSDDFGAELGLKPQIARVTIDGMILEDRRQLALLEKLGREKPVKAVILAINSPGGTTAGGEALYDGIRRLAKKKPVVAVFGTVAASAAYMAGIAADHVVARGNSITGSVGVIFQWAEVSELMKTLGVKVEEVRSGPLKAVPSPFQPTDAESRKLTEDMVRESAEWFLQLVAKRRQIRPEEVAGLREGRVFSGRQALRYRLVDALGGEETAIDWLEKNKKVPKNLPVIDWKPDTNDSYDFLFSAARLLGRLTGLPLEQWVGAANSNTTLARLRLDGLVSLWHPSVRD